MLLREQRGLSFRSCTGSVAIPGNPGSPHVSLSLLCPLCGKRFTADPGPAGLSSRCPDCNKIGLVDVTVLPTPNPGQPRTFPVGKLVSSGKSRRKPTAAAKPPPPPPPELPPVPTAPPAPPPPQPAPRPTQRPPEGPGLAVLILLVLTAMAVGAGVTWWVLSQVPKPLTHSPPPEPPSPAPNPHDSAPAPPPRAVEESLPTWIKQLIDPDEGLRTEAERDLVHRGAKVSAELRAGLGSGNPNIRRVTASVCGKIGAGVSDLIPALADALKDTDDGVREEAARALGRMGGVARRTYPALVLTLGDPN